MERQLKSDEPICPGDIIKLVHDVARNDEIIVYAFREEPEPEPTPPADTDPYRDARKAYEAHFAKYVRDEPEPEPSSNLNFGQAMAAVWKGKMVGRELTHGCKRFLCLGLTGELFERNTSHWDGGRWNTAALNSDDTGCNSWRIWPPDVKAV